jgi:PKD repeat protein
VNSSATFTNTSVGYNAASGVCTNNDPVMWSISPSTGWTSGSNFGNTFGLTDPNLWSGGSNSLGVNFNTIGIYTITLITGSTHLCGLDTLTRTICVVPPAQPAFNMTPPNGCAPSTVTVSNTSLGSAGCSSLGYSWVVSYSSGCIYYSSGSYTYSSGSNSAQNPVFTFSTPGNYNITLNVTNACGTVSASQSTVVKDLPYITTSSVSGACGSNTVNPASYFGFNGCGGTISNYAWTFNNGTPSTGTGASPGNVTFTNAGSNAISVAGTDSTLTKIKVKANF